jgi:hypothetical protein
MVDQFVDSFVTPQGLADLLAKRNGSPNTDIAITRTGFIDFDEYTIEFGQTPVDPGKTLSAVLRRQGIVWRVVRVGFPPGKAPWDAAEAAGVGLKIQKLTPARTANGLIIEGDVLNAGPMPREVPQLRVALRDAAEKELQFKVIEPPVARLAPGEVAHFKTPFERPDDAATGVMVTFTSHIISWDNRSVTGGRTDNSAPPRSPASKPEERNPTLKLEAPQQVEKTERSTEQNSKPKPAAQVAKQDVNSNDKKYDVWQFDALLKNLAPGYTTAPGDGLRQTPPVTPTPPPSEPKVPVAGQLTASELGIVRHQITRCWNVPAGARDAKDLVVEIKVIVDPDGTVRQATIVDQGRLGSDPFFRAAAESARRAFFNPLCRPLPLPSKRYAIWKDFVIDFSPKDLF